MFTSKKVVVGSTFKQLVLDNQMDVLLQFHAPWCPFSKKLAPKYKKLAELLTLNPNILVASIDSSKNEVHVT